MQLVFANSLEKIQKELPLLVIIGRYKMSQFYELRRLMENITSIITPVKQEEIRTRDDGLLGVT
jgi:hypothetical protein